MTVKELLNELSQVADQDSQVVVQTQAEGTGCDTCGYGAMLVNVEIVKVSWLDGCEVLLEIY